MKQHSNKTHCPVCTEFWEECTCEEMYPEPEMIKLDDENIQSTIDFEQ